MHDDPILYRANITMLLLCAFSGFWLLASPLVPYEFNTQTFAGMALFLLVHQTLTVSFAAMGIMLNGMSVRDERVTVETLRRLVRRGRN